MRRFVAFVFAILLAGLMPAHAQGFSDPQKEDIGRIVKEYLLKNPEIIQEALAELDRRTQAEEAAKRKSRIKELAGKLFDSPRGAVIGNPQGDVTLVEFFDYNCGYCKRALADLIDLTKADPKLRIVLKEFPVLGPGSIEAAQVAAAVKLQAKGAKYFEFHQKLLLRRGQADKAAALAIARETGKAWCWPRRSASTARPPMSLARRLSLARSALRGFRMRSRKRAAARRRPADRRLCTGWLPVARGRAYKVSGAGLRAASAPIRPARDRFSDPTCRGCFSFSMVRT
jgi:protein-disulfide isomerase